MKFFIASFLILNFCRAQILFLDMNNNEHEKRAAIEEANQAGEEIIVYPEGDALFDKAQAFELLAEHKPRTLFLSGHDGGGKFGGDRGESFGINDLEDFVRTRPGVKDNLRVLGLLGCYTANHLQIMNWRNLFPNVSFVAGYDGTAPLGERPIGWDYIKDIISKSDEILKETDGNRLKNIFENFSQIEDLQASLFADLNRCQETDVERQFIFRPQRPSDERFKTFDTAECISKKEEFLNRFHTQYTTYFSGQTPIPEDTSTGELREIYSFTRQNEHCIGDYEGVRYPSGDELLFLLFFKDVQINFNRYYEENLKEMFKELEAFSSAESLEEKRQELIAHKEEEIGKLQSYINDYQTYANDFEAFIERQEAVYGERLEGHRAELAQGQNSRTYQELQEKVLSLQSELEILKNEPDSETISFALSAYDRLPAKNFEQFKNLDRQQVAAFSHGLNWLISSDIHVNNGFVYEMKQAINTMLYELSNEIPFNWHDSALEEVSPPTASNFVREDMLNRHQKSFGERIFN